MYFIWQVILSSVLILTIKVVFISLHDQQLHNMNEIETKSRYQILLTGLSTKNTVIVIIERFVHGFYTNLEKLLKMEHNMIFRMDLQHKGIPKMGKEHDFMLEINHNMIP